MSKERTSLSLDPDVAEYLRQEGVNASGLVNKLVKQYMSGGGSDDQIREFRKQQLKSEYKDAAAKARRKIEQLNELEGREAAETTVSDDRRAELYDKVRRVPKDPEHMIVQDAADELDIPPEDVIREAYNERN